MLNTSLVNYLQLVVVALWYLRWEINDMFCWCGRHLLIGISLDHLIIQLACRRSLGCGITILCYFNPDIVVKTSSMTTMHQVFSFFTLCRQAVLLKQARVCEMRLIH